MHVGIKYAAFTAFSAFTVGMAFLSYHKWTNSLYFDPKKGSRPAYSSSEFTFFISLIILGSFGYALALQVSRLALRLPYGIGHVLSVLAFAALYIVAINHNIMATTCNVVDCVHSDKNPIKDPQTKETKFGIGMKTLITGIVAVPSFVYAVIVGVFALYNLFMFFRYKHSRNAGQALLINGYTTHGDVVSVVPKKSSSYELLIPHVFAAFILSYFYIVSSLIPNIWRKMTPESVASFLAMDVGVTREECLSGKFLCPEVDGAVFRTQVSSITEFVLFKSFPSIYIFYGFLAAVFVLSAIWAGLKFMGISANRELRLQSSNSLLSPFLGKNNKTQKFRAYIDLFNFLLIFLFVIFIQAFFQYWHMDHNYKSFWPKPSISNTETFMRSVGQVATVLMALLLFPVAKASPLLRMLGLSFEKSLVYHRFLGTLCLFGIIAHVILAYKVILDYNSYNVFFTIPAKFVLSRGAVGDFTITQMNYVTLASIFTLTFAAIPYLRRTFYRAFLYMHYVTYMVLIPSVIIHAPAALQYFAPALAIYFIDYAFQVARRSRRAELAVMNSNTDNSDTDFIEPEVASHNLAIFANDYGLAGKYITMHIVKKNFNYRAGQFVYVNIPEVSLFEWHPFTIASAEKHGITHQFTLHIKVSDSKFAWTKQQYNMVEQNQRNSSFNLTIHVDGPFATPIDFLQYKHVVQLSGGAGITPCISIYDTLWNFHHSHSTRSDYATAMHVSLLFVARDPSLFALVNHGERHNPSTEFKMDLFCSERGVLERYHNQTRVQPYRPDITEYLQTLDLNVNSDEKVLVFVCGPEAMQTEAQDFCYRKPNYTFHTEVFDF